MDDNTEDLFDALLALRMDWEATAEHYRQTVASHMRRGLDDISLSPSELALVAGDVMRYTAALEQIRVCLDAVDGILQVAEELRIARVQLVPPSSTGSPPQGDGVPF